MGIASIRYNKRGVDDASELPHQTSSYLVSDAQSAVQTAITLVPANTPVFLVGLSEGALVATIIAKEDAGKNIKGVFLLSTPTPSITDILKYQFVQWPFELVSNRADLNRDGILDTAEMQNAGSAPLLKSLFFPEDFKNLDDNADGKIDLAAELLPKYLANFKIVMRVVTSDPSYLNWYSELSKLPSYEDLAKAISSPVFMYHGAKDAQVPWLNAYLMQSNFSNLRQFRIYPNLGHCFAPMKGQIGEEKTSGPLSQSLLDDLAADAKSLL